MSFKDVLNKHYAHTQKSVKKYEVGGKVVTKEGATNDAKMGGYFDGRPHSEGGIKAINIDNNQPIEVEGGEVVITKRAVSDKSKKEFEGEMMTNKEILSKINESGGGVSFEKGGELNTEEMADIAGNTALGAEMQFAKGGLVAPNGKPSNLNHEQWHLVRTPEFKAWFGDWGNDPLNASKVVDENGEPLVMYRGETEKTRNVSGFWLTKSKNYAEDYGVVKGYFVRIFKPMPEEKFDKTWEVDYEKYDGRLGDFHKLVVKDISQIKLADGTNTTFDGKNPDIRFDKGGCTIAQTPPQTSMEDEDYEVTDDDLNFDIDHEIFEDGGSVGDDAKKKLFEEFPFFAPDAVKEYDPLVLNVLERWSKSLGGYQESVRRNLMTERNIEAYSRLIKDIPVENVVERTLLSRALNDEQENLNQMSNWLLQDFSSTLSLGKDDKGNNIPYERSMSMLIKMGQDEEKWLLTRPDLGDFYNLFSNFINYCVTNPNSYYTEWTTHFFGDYIGYSESKNHNIIELNSPENLPENLSRVYEIKMIEGKYYLTPSIVFQGLSQPYDRVGFDTFPISYYASNYYYANWFAESKGANNNTKGIVLPCMLNIRRPLDLSFFYIDKVSPKNFFDAIYIQTGLTPEDLKVNPAFLLPTTPDMEVWVYIRNNQEMLKILKESKIVDGIHMYENNPAVDKNDNAYATEVWITFYSEQTKVLPLMQFEKYANLYQDRGYFTKSQFLRRGGKL